jgi:hypothetical protein
MRERMASGLKPLYRAGLTAGLKPRRSRRVGDQVASGHSMPCPYKFDGNCEFK